MEERSNAGGMRRPPAAQVPVGNPVDRLLGERLVEAGVLTRSQLDQALEVHQTLAALAEPRWLGELLVTLGFVSAERVLPYASAQYRAHLLRQIQPPCDDTLVARLTGCLRHVAGMSR